MRAWFMPDFVCILKMQSYGRISKHNWVMNEWSHMGDFLDVLL